MILCISSFITRAQKGKITGKVFAITSREAIAQANVQLLDKDSLPIRSAVSDSLGNFLFNNISAGKYFIHVEALSYSGFTKRFNLSNKGWHDTIFMQPSYQDLQSVVVTAKRPVVVIKPDTTEFNVASFKTEKNATLEDIFKKLPDVEVSKNGSIKAQGERITQIYVDGKPFFGTDLKAVTQNFPAEMIDKIQIIDKKSDQALATKIDDGSYERIINITLKKNSEKGVFGKGYIGYGTNNRYEAKANANIFNNSKKFSVIAGINNTGKYDGNNNTAPGVIENKQLKINYGNKLGNNFDFNVWAAYEQNKNNIEQVISKQNFFSDSSTCYSENNSSNSLSKNISSGFYFEYKPDTLSVLRFNESVNYNDLRSNSVSKFITTAFNQYKINEGDNKNDRLSATPSLHGQISYNRRLSGSGRNLFFSFSNVSNNNHLTTYNSFNNYFFPADTVAYTLISKQFQYNNNRNTNIGTSISYSEPLATNHILNFGYTYNADKNNMPEEVYDFNDQTGLFNLLNDSLSYHFTNNTNSSTVSLNYNYSSKKTGFGAGMRWKQSLTQNFSFDKEMIYQQTYNGFLPNLSFYSVGKGKRFNLYYNSYIQSPQSYQVQPIVNNTNPLYVRLGNADLKYAVVHMLRYNFKYYNNKKGKGFNSSAIFSSVANNIANSIYYDNTTGKEISKPINTNGAGNWNVWVSYFQPLYIGHDKIKWNVNLSRGGFKVTNLLNGEKNVNRNNVTRVFLGLTYDTQPWLDLHTNVSLNKQISKYSLQQENDHTSYQLILSPTISLKPVKNIEINIDYDYSETTARATSFHTSINMLNVDITKYLNDKKEVWLTLKAYNIFDQNGNAWLTYGNNFIQDVNANVLRRYLLITANFRLNKIGQ